MERARRGSRGRKRLGLQRRQGLRADLGASTGTREESPNDYSVDVRIDYADSRSRGWAALTITLIEFLALVPHAVVLLFLGIAQFFVFLAAQVAVTTNGEYPSACTVSSPA